MMTKGGGKKWLKNYVKYVAANAKNDTLLDTQIRTIKTQQNIYVKNATNQ